VPAADHVLRHRDAHHQFAEGLRPDPRDDRRRSRSGDDGSVAVHLPQGLRGVPVRLRVSGGSGSVLPVHHRHNRPVPLEQEEERLMTQPQLMVTGEQRLRRLSDPATDRRAGESSGLRRLGRIVGYLALGIFAIGLLAPFAWMLLSSLKTANEVFSVPIVWWPETFVWQNYIDIWSKSNMLTWIRNTLLLAVVVTFLQVLTGSFAAYGFSRMRFRGRDALFLAYIGTIAVPWQSYMIPQFILLSNLKVSNTLWAIILIQAFGAFGVFLMKQYYETIPEELSEAARIDGLSEYGIWRRIMV